MPTNLPVPTKNPGDVLTSALWNSYLRDNLNKLLNLGHRKLTVAQVAALTGQEDGDEVYMEVDSSLGKEWHLVYRTAEPTYKWRFLGGSPLYSEVATSETFTSSAYSALATAGPLVALPRAGDYEVELGCRFYMVTANVAYALNMSYDVGGTGAVDGDSVQWTTPNGAGSPTGTVVRVREKAALAAVTLTSKYKNSNNVNAQGAADRWMRVRPVRI